MEIGRDDLAMDRQEAQQLLSAAGAKLAYKSRYDNFIGGQWVAPVKGQYFDVVTPISGKVYTRVARSTAEDIELALDAAHAAADKWGKTPPAERANTPSSTSACTCTLRFMDPPKRSVRSGWMKSRPTTFRS